jgi:hypothetical protein
VQQVDYAKLRQRLLDAQQVLEWTGPATKGGKGVDPKTLPGVVVDDADAKLTGEWLHGSVTGPFVGSGYAHDGGTDKKDKSARFEARLPAAGKYEVRLAYPANPNRCRNVPVTVQASDGPHTVQVDQQKAGPIDGLFVSLGVFSFDAAQPAVVELRCADTKGYVIIDAVQFLPAK